MLSEQAILLLTQAMERSQQYAERLAAEHLRAFKMQMREKFGIEEITLNEPYLPFLLVRSELRYLLRLQKLEMRFLHPQSKAEETPIPAGLEAAIADATARSGIETKQDLDSARQQSFGIHQYIWRGGECSICAPNDGQIFAWGEGEEPGNVHPNCLCYAEPVLEGAGESDPPEITADDILDAGLLLGSLGSLLFPGSWVAAGVAAVSRLGSLGRTIQRLAGRGTSRVVGPRMNDTETWPRPPKEGSFKEGNPSRTKPRNRGEKSLYDEQGGEWRYNPGDKYHNPHWDYKPLGKNQKWENIPIDGLPPRK